MNTLTVAPDSLNIPTIWLGPVAVLTRSHLNATAFDALAALVRKEGSVMTHEIHHDPAVRSIVGREVAKAIAAERERLAAEIAQSVSYGFGMRPDGSEDPQAAAYLEGLHDAWHIVRADTPPAASERAS